MKFTPEEVEEILHIPHDRYHPHKFLLQLSDNQAGQFRFTMGDLLAFDIVRGRTGSRLAFIQQLTLALIAFFNSADYEELERSTVVVEFKGSTIRKVTTIPKSEPPRWNDARLHIPLGPHIRKLHRSILTPPRTPW